MRHKEKIGFIGQGWIGKHYADDFEARGYQIVRYALEEPYCHNQAKLADCTIIFIAVPTPTKHQQFDDTHLRSALQNVPEGAMAVVKSTTLPGTISRLQTDLPLITVLHSPEFLVEKTAAYDAAHPQRNIVGVPVVNQKYQAMAERVLAVLPKAPYETVMPSLESEMVKYAGNCFLYSKLVFMNMLYDAVTHNGGDFETVREALINDPRIGASHTQPVLDNTRGAGGHCFIKDFEAFRQYYIDSIADPNGKKLLAAMVAYNNDLLRTTNKDLDLLTDVYGEDGD